MSIWIRIRIQIQVGKNEKIKITQIFLPPGSGSRRHFFMRIRVDPDPKHCFYVPVNTILNNMH